jgi:hypothetical protein
VYALADHQLLADERLLGDDGFLAHLGDLDHALLQQPALEDFLVGEAAVDGATFEMRLLVEIAQPAREPGFR